MFKLLSYAIIKLSLGDTTHSEAMMAGRPTKYDERYIDGMVDYFTQEQQPFFEEYANSIGVHHDTLREWRDVHEAFSVSYKRCRDIQSYKLQKQGLNNDVNSTMAIFLLKASHGMKETSVVEAVVTETRSLDDFYDE